MFLLDHGVVRTFCLLPGETVALLPLGIQAGFDISQALTTRHLSIGGTHKPIECGKDLGPVIAAITANGLIKIMSQQKLQQFLRH